MLGKVRLDLIRDSPLLEALGGLIEVDVPARNQQPIIIAAPHEAPTSSPLASGHDQDTGPLAKALAVILGAKSVIVNEFRTFIDINKDPFENESRLTSAGAKASSRLKLFYQSQLFTGFPKLIVEIHGHVGGKYDIEISSGSGLSGQVPQDKAAITALKDMREELQEPLGNMGITLGIFPLDSDVYFQATRTHTFLRIERLRELGISIHGLHIEIHKRLRVDNNPQGYSNLVKLLGRGIQKYLDSFQSTTQKGFDRKGILVDLFGARTDPSRFLPLSDRSLIVQMAPRELVNRDIVILSEQDLKSLGLVDGEEVSLARDKAGTGLLRVHATSGERRSGTVSMPRKVRDALHVDKGDRVYIGKPQEGKPDNLRLENVYCVLDPKESTSPNSVWISTPVFRRMFGEVGDPVRANLRLTDGRGGRMVDIRSADLEGYNGYDEVRGIVVGYDLAQDAGLVVGDLVMLSSDEDEKLIPDSSIDSEPRTEE